MNFVILYIFLLSTIVYKIDAGDCAERACVTASSSWCCPFSSTCGSSGVCNNVTVSLRDSRCPGQHACYSLPYYWCCDSDQTCGGYATCEGGGLQNASAILKYVGIGVSVLALLLALCGCIVRHNRQMAAKNQMITSVNNPRVHISPNSFTNMGRPIQPYPLEKSFPMTINSDQVARDQILSPAALSVPPPPPTGGQ